MRTVCIVGAGPGGLVTAKTLLQTQQFKVKVFEKKDRIGGIWALDRGSTDGYLNPYTPTNLSRFTVAFSDLDWNAVDLSLPHTGATVNGVEATCQPPAFPRAWMANRYLEAYRKRYIPENVVHCGKAVIAAHRTGNKWQVKSISTSEGVEQVEHFDLLVLASGFFAQPRLIAIDVPGVRDATAIPPLRVLHSSTFRQLSDLLAADTDVKGKKILMLGGGNSSGETAAAIALQLSNAQWQPDATLRERYVDCAVLHVTPRPLYSLPPFVEYADASRSYVPIDLKLYETTKRPRDMAAKAGLQPKDRRDMVHGVMQSIIGGDQSDINPALVAHPGDSRGSPYAALTESYAEFVRSGMIQVVSGRVTGIADGQGGGVIATVRTGEGDVQLNDIAAVVFANGYSPLPTLDILDETTKRAIQYDPTSLRLPAILEQWQTMNRSAPELSLIGMYEGPYWGIMEMQARLTAQRWLTGNLAPQTEYEKPDSLIKLRESFKHRSIDAPQFWFGDYPGYMEEMATYLDLEPNDNGFKGRDGCISPSRYQAKSIDATQTDAVMKDLHQTWNDCVVKGKYVARAAFRALQGSWTIDRIIKSAIPTFPSGKLTGTASFHPRFPTSDRSGQSFDFEYLYTESGDFTTSTGHSMTASRRYVYRYNEAEDKLSVWFVKPDSNLEADYLFHGLAFSKPEDARKEGACVATADHLCVEDMYNTRYRLPLKGVALTAFEVVHEVKGPAKDYVSTTWYSRPPR